MVAFFQYLISRNAVRIIQRLLRFAVWCRQSSLPNWLWIFISSLAAIGHYAMMVFTQVAVICLVVTSFFFLCGFWLPKSVCRNKGLAFGLWLFSRLLSRFQIHCQWDSIFVAAILHDEEQGLRMLRVKRKNQVNQKVLRHNKAIKVMHYTRRFWYGVRCALLVQWGTPYGRRYGSFLPVIFMV